MTIFEAIVIPYLSQLIEEMSAASKKDDEKFLNLMANIFNSGRDPVLSEKKRNIEKKIQQELNEFEDIKTVCGLFKGSNPPSNALFEPKNAQFGSSEKKGDDIKNRSAIFLHNNVLFYVDKIAKEISKIKCTEDNRESYHQLKTLCTASYRTVSDQEVELINKFTTHFKKTDKDVFNYILGLIYKLKTECKAESEENGSGPGITDKKAARLIFFVQDFYRLMEEYHFLDQPRDDDLYRIEMFHCLDYIAHKVMMSYSNGTATMLANFLGNASKITRTKVTGVLSELLSCGKTIAVFDSNHADYTKEYGSAVIKSIADIALLNKKLVDDNAIIPKIPINLTLGSIYINGPRLKPSLGQLEDNLDNARAEIEYVLTEKKRVKKELASVKKEKSEAIPDSIGVKNPPQPKTAVSHIGIFKKQPKMPETPKIIEQQPPVDDDEAPDLDDIIDSLKDETEDNFEHLVH
jgi:hypothetical protein